MQTPLLKTYNYNPSRDKSLPNSILQRIWTKWL